MRDKQTENTKPRRPSRRQRQVEQTRSDIIEAARELFVRNGFVATTVDDIAVAAGVAVQTIYSSVGSKAALLIHLMELARQAAEIPAMDEWRDHANDPLELPRVGARLRRQLMEQAGDIIRLLAEAAPSNPDVAAVWQAAMKASRAGAGVAMRRLADLGGLAPGLDVDTATDIAFVVAHPKVYLELQDLGWSHDRIEGWLVEITTKAVVDPTLVDGSK